MLMTGGVVSVNGRKLCPRIILMTDGKPTDENGHETQQVRTLILIRQTARVLALPVLSTRAMNIDWSHLCSRECLCIILGIPRYPDFHIRVRILLFISK